MYYLSTEIFITSVFEKNVFKALIVNEPLNIYINIDKHHLYTLSDRFVYVKGMFTLESA